MTRERTCGTLILENDIHFEGDSFGAERGASGEVVFSTGMTGYPESLTDPSFRGQILVLTYPLIGNYGVPARGTDVNGLPTSGESERIHVAGLVVADYVDRYHHWSAGQSLSAWLSAEGVPALTGVDTRALTRRLREQGVMLGKVAIGGEPELSNPNLRNLVDEVSVREPVQYGRGRRRIVLVDCGVKRSIITSLLSRDATVIRVPWDHDILSERPDGILLSNGPGDPTMCQKTIERVREAIEARVPIFGVCLGNQILALAAGASTYKLKYGHRSQNQPCIDKETGRCHITSQNHGFAVNLPSLPEGWKEWWTNANDRTNEGVIHSSGLWGSVQFHPEGNPGPEDTAFLFDRFMKVVDDAKG